MIIISEPKLKTQTTNWRLSRDIPNQDGFNLVVQRADGFLILTKVIKNGDGLHVLRDVKISDVYGWRPATTAEMELKPI